MGGVPGSVDLVKSRARRASLYIYILYYSLFKYIIIKGFSAPSPAPNKEKFDQRTTLIRFLTH